ncbi:MAG: hypothetical protein HFE85_05385 [Clostridiales bacterium]|nr:hypothetical protein [Clostridiales bacterium]
MIGGFTVDRKEKSITESCVRICYEKAVEIGGDVSEPKKLCVLGSPYLYELV